MVSHQNVCIGSGVITRTVLVLSMLQASFPSFPATRNWPTAVASFSSSLARKCTWRQKCELHMTNSCNWPIVENFFYSVENLCEISPNLNTPNCFV